MRAAGAMCAHFKGGLRSKPPGAYTYAYVRPRSGPCEATHMAERSEPCDVWPYIGPIRWPVGP